MPTYLTIPVSFSNSNSTHRTPLHYSTLHHATPGHTTHTTHVLLTNLHAPTSVAHIDVQIQRVAQTEADASDVTVYDRERYTVRLKLSTTDAKINKASVKAKRRTRPIMGRAKAAKKGVASSV